MVSIRIIVIFSIIWRVPARHDSARMEISAARLKKFGVNSIGELALELERSSYGLKQSGRLWNELLVSTLITLGFEQCITDSCVFYKLDGRETVLVGVCVDDLIVTSTTTCVVDKLFTNMLIFKLKDLSVLPEFLGVHFLQCDDRSVKIDQEQTIIEMVDKHDLS
ncbi:unnamed protein product [Peronospora destructor]|uniref:Reverse transcriptase Ty1/copia-type domain-containing protein n=1 Tax=Peronospora destructor TaxID=86335 RepID=A0AAV0V7X6_9STRA|nr:unnamed protein product [Peronospora destructor]